MFFDSTNNKQLRELISENLGYDGEIIVTPALDSKGWWGQNPSGRPGPTDEIPPIAKILKKEPYSPPDPETVNKWWTDAKGNPEICTISWLRPQCPSQKGFQRKTSDYWVDKVRGRAKEWYKNLDKTIWIDEVADSNGRICLIVGKLDIENWLSPEGHIKTLLIRPSNGDPASGVPKTPSFARIHRVWETTKTFWREINQEFSNTAGSVTKRLKLTGDFNPKNGNGLSDHNTYEADFKGVRFSVFHPSNREFLVIENLQWLAKKMGADQKDVETYESSVEYVKRELGGKLLKIYEPEGENREHEIGSFKISQIGYESTSYTPVISILSEPSIFMAIVPADKALKVANGIKKKYEKEMSKVRNRLPISLGMVFARSHTPLVALMDAGRRMLRVSNSEEYWTLNGDSQDCGMDCILNFENGITWRVPVKMGDETTDDVWYPYFYVNGVPENRSTAFRGPKGWLVHVKELKKGDRVKITPSRFDFEFLDTSSRRFEVSYDDNGKRRGSMKKKRPYLLEELEDFDRLWCVLSKSLARSQIKTVIDLIETKREEWRSEEDTVFEKFVHDVLHNAYRKNGIPSRIEEIEKAAISGKLRDIVELYMDILKINIEKEKQQEVSK